MSSEEELENRAYEDAIDRLAKSILATREAQAYLNAAKIQFNNQSTINPTSIKVSEKIVAQKLIDNAEVEVKKLSNLDVENRVYGNVPEETLDISKQYYSDGNYYLSIMNSAEAVAMADFELNKDIDMTNISQVLDEAQVRFNRTSEYFDGVHSDYNIDAPVAELHLEMAGLRLDNALESEGVSKYTFAVDSIRNSLVAEKQTKALLDLNEAVNNPSDFTPSTQIVQSPLGILPLIGIVLACIYIRR